nr:hypothetical protein [uncultured bacterium]
MNPGRFGLVELDLLAANADAVIPYPLRVPSFGRIPAERDVLFAAAGETLRRRGLADEYGPIGLAKAVVTALATRSGTVDVVVTRPGGSTGVLAMVHRGKALLCRQNLNGPVDELVEVWSIPLDGLAHALTGVIPGLPGARTMPVRLPLAAVNAVQRTLADGTPMAGQVRRIAAEHGCSTGDLETLIRLGSTVTGRGQLGVTRSSVGGEDVRVGVELSWVDTTHGRLRVTRQTDHSGGWLSINPMRTDDLRSVIVAAAAL